MMKENENYREELLQAVETLTDDQLNKQVGEGKWSIMQVLEHLYLLENVVAKMIKSQLASDSANSIKEKTLEHTVNRSIKIDAPAFLIPTTDYITLEDMKKKLSKSRTRLIEAIDGIELEKLKYKSYPHPIFGDLPLNQWVMFVGLHEMRHLQQIEEIKEMI